MTNPQSARLSNLRVTIVSHGYGYGGDLMYYGEIFRQLHRLLPKLTIVTDSLTRFDNRYGLPLAPWMRLRRFALQRRTKAGEIYDTEMTVPGPGLLSRLLSRSTDVFIAIEFTPPALAAVLAASLVPRRALVLLIESDPVGRGGSSNRAVLRLKKWAVGRATIIQTNNARGRDYLLRELGADPARIRVAPYLTSRPPGPAPDLSATDGRPIRILFANSLTKRKGLEAFIAALDILPDRLRHRFTMTIVGDGPERPELERAVQEARLAGQVTFAGKHPYRALGEFYADADILAIPSRADYRSLSGFEGLGYGLALLSSAHDGASEETVIDGMNGYIIDPGDIAGTAEKLALLLEDRDRLTAMRRASLELYEARFSVERIARNLADSALEAAGMIKGGAAMFRAEGDTA